MKKTNWAKDGVIAGAAIGALVLGGIGVSRLGAHTSGAPRAAVPGAVSSGSVTAQGSGVVIDPQSFTTLALFPRGVGQTYDLRQTTRLTTSAGQVLTEVEFAGALTLTGIPSEHGALVRGEFDGTITVAAAGNPSAEAGAAMVEPSRRPFYLEFADDGSFRGARGDASVPAMVARVWSALGEYLQFVRPARGDHWQTQESDGTGTYLAEYDQAARQDVNKRKLRYESLKVADMASYDLAWSKIDFHVDTDSRLTGYAMEERSKANPGSGPIPAFESASALVLRRTRVEARSDRLVAWAAEASVATPLSRVRAEQDQHARDRARIAETSVAKVFDDLSIFQKEKMNKAETDRAGRAFAALTSMIREDPGMLDTVRKHLEAKGPDTETMLAALRDASTPASQRLLAQMTLPTSPLDADGRMEAARSLSRVPVPSAETVQTLKQLRSDPDVGIQANYGLGSALHRIKDTDPVLANDVRSTLVNQLDTATTDQIRTATLTAFGNAGDPQTLPTIRRYVTDPSPAVRGAAAQALRRIHGAEADGLLAALCGDPESTVRYEAVDAIHERAASPVLAAALSPLALAEPSYGIRAASVNVLSAWVSEIPAIAETLKAVASRDRNADLRNVAKNALAAI